MTAREWSFGRLRATRFCDDPTAPILYVHGDAEALSQLGWTVVNVEGIDWNRDLSPWPAKAVFRGQPDFGGGAGEYLRELTERIMPTVEADLQPAFRGVAGYSLAGLFAVYAALETDLFDCCASVSGSMWYPGFLEYVAQKQSAPRLAYFSVGEREKLSRNAAFRTIDDCTLRVKALLAERGTATVFEHNPGNHFDDPAGRMAKAVRWLNENLKVKP